MATTFPSLTATSNGGLVPSGLNALTFDDPEWIYPKLSESVTASEYLRRHGLGLKKIKLQINKPEYPFRPHRTVTIYTEWFQAQCHEPLQYTVTEMPIGDWINDFAASEKEPLLIHQFTDYTSGSTVFVECTKFEGFLLSAAHQLLVSVQRTRVEQLGRKAKMGEALKRKYLEKAEANFKKFYGEDHKWK